MRHLLLLAALLAAGSLAGCGGDEDVGSGDLVWEKKPQVFRSSSLPDDRVLVGTVRNDSLELIDVTARGLEVVADDGDELESAAIFAQTFVRGVFPQNRGEDIPPGEQLRIGLRARLQPGKTAPLTVSWRQRGERAARIEYGTGSLPVPRG